MTTDEFTLELRLQREWEWLIAIGFFLAGVGAGLFVISFFLSLNTIALIGVILGALGGLALFFDLGRPENVWRAFAHLRTSWISWGVTLLTVFLITGLLHSLPALSWFNRLPWSPETGVGYILGIIATVAAFGVMGYTGFVLAYSRAIALWNTTLLPVLFILYSFMGALGIVSAIGLVVDRAKIDFRLLQIGEIALIGISLVIIAVYLMTISYSTLAARESVRVLVRGELAKVFIGGTVIIGLVVPLVIAIIAFSSGADTNGAPLLVVASVLELTGGFLLRYSLVRAGIYQVGYK